MLWLITVAGNVRERNDAQPLLAEKPDDPGTHASGHALRRTLPHDCAGGLSCVSPLHNG